VVKSIVTEHDGAVFVDSEFASGSRFIIELPLEGPDRSRPPRGHPDARRPGQLVLLITAFGSIELAVQAVRAGACDFVAKPFKLEVLVLAIERALREREMRREIVRLRTALPGAADGDLVAKSPAMRAVVELASHAALIDSTVLLTGESGTGKGAVACFIHQRSARAAAPFVSVNCAALPAQLVESELFGVRKGAFTDARSDRPGLFVEAAGGTLFLDEIGEMPVETQAKLLQALETGRVWPLGGGEVEVDVRVLAATNRPLEEALRDRRFRPDLYCRLNVIRIELPPLRQRTADIEALIDVFLHRAAAKLDRPIIGVSGAAMRWMLSYDWPGNVRELGNLLERAVALADHDSGRGPDVGLAGPPQPGPSRRRPGSRPTARRPRTRLHPQSAAVGRRQQGSRRAHPRHRPPHPLPQARRGVGDPAGRRCPRGDVAAGRAVLEAQGGAMAAFDAHAEAVDRQIFDTRPVYRAVEFSAR
jgi:DNA-binding NtrC family response regulator